MRLWIVGRRIDGPDGWEFVGAFDDEGKAVSACYDESCFVGPAVLNVPQPRETQEWKGAYAPLAEGPDVR